MSNYDSVFANAAEDIEDFDVMFDQEDDLIDTIVGVDESGVPLTGKNFDELHQEEDKDTEVDNNFSDDDNSLDSFKDGSSDSDDFIKNSEEEYQKLKNDAKVKDTVTGNIEDEEFISTNEYFEDLFREDSSEDNGGDEEFTDSEKDDEFVDGDSSEDECGTNNYSYSTNEEDDEFIDGDVDSDDSDDDSSDDDDTDDSSEEDDDDEKFIDGECGECGECGDSNCIDQDREDKESIGAPSPTMDGTEMIDEYDDEEDECVDEGDEEFIEASIKIDTDVEKIADDEGDEEFIDDKKTNKKASINLDYSYDDEEIIDSVLN